MQKRFLPTHEALARAVRKGRTQKEWSQSVLAEAASVTQDFVSRLEDGQPWSEPGDVGRTIDVLKTLDIHAVALPPDHPPPQVR